MTDQNNDQPRQNIWKVLIPVIGIILLVFAGLSFLKSQTGHSPEAGRAEVKLGATLPDFEITPFGGSPTQFSELKAKVVLINFWATWCEACMVEMPSIIQLRNSYKDQGLEVLAVNLDEKPEAVLPKTLKDLGINFPVYLDPESKIGDLFDVHAIPLTVIVDKSRKILLIHNGERDWNGTDIRAQIEQWLK